MKKTCLVFIALLMLTSVVLNASQRFIVGEVFTETW